jgi:cytosine/adenosine deaminase-related metal-dependent hydrolase
MFGRPPACIFINGRVITDQGEAQSVRFRRRILDVDGPPHDGDRVLDLDGRIVLPGLINAHDHLELNHYGALKCRPKYENASDWIRDLEPLVRRDAEVVAKSRVPLRDRLFIGGLKNLLAGVTTVAHHNPIYRAFGRHFPVNIVSRFGWAHSLQLERGPAGAHGEPGGSIAERYASTPPDAPFIVHAAEGIDAAAADEIDALESRGCLRANTVLVHGVAVPTTRWRTLFARGVGLIWCPASNLFLFGQTVAVPPLLAEPAGIGGICLGTDSRLTGSRDLLAEVQVAESTGVDSDALLRMVTSTAADVLRMPLCGRIAIGGAADLIILPAGSDSPGTLLARCERAHLDLVVRGGTPVLGSMPLARVFTAQRVSTALVVVDEQVKLMQSRLADAVACCEIREPGVMVRSR